MLTTRAIQAARWTATSSVFRACVQVGQLAILARLLDPSDFGLMAIAMVVVAYGGIFADAGLSSAVIQRRDLSRDERSSLYWFNLFAAVIVGALVALSAPLLGKLYGDDRIATLVWICAPMFALTAAGRQIEAMAERSIAFRALSVNEMAVPLVSAGVAVSSAAFGLGAKSIAIGALAAAATRALLAWVVLSREWRPRWHSRWQDVRAHWGFGSALTLSNAINQFTSTSDVVLGARLLGIDLIGLYSAPRQIVHAVLGVINPVVTRISFPVIAEVQLDQQRVLHAYRETIRMTAGVNAPIYLGLAALGPELCLLVLGPAWRDAGFVLSALGVAGLLRALVNPVGSLLLGVGRAEAALRWNLCVLGLYVPALYVGSKFGVLGLATVAVVVMSALFVPAWYWLVRPFTGWPLRNYLAVTFRPIALAALSIVPARLCAVPTEDPALRVAITVAISVPVYCLLSAWYNRDFVGRMHGVVADRA